MKTGLTLGSGAARGLTHIGVLKALDEFDIKIIGNTPTDQKHDLPTFGKILYQMFAIVQIQMAHLTLKMAQPDIVIEPDTTKYSLFDFIKGKELIEIGYQAAIEVLNDYPSENN